MNDLVAKINQLAALRVQCDSLRAEHLEHIALIENEIKEYAPLLWDCLLNARKQLAEFDKAMAEQVSELEGECKAEVGKLGASVDGTYANPDTGKVLRVGWYEGTRKVDIKRFDGYCIAHPDAKVLIEQGEPVVKILEVKSKGNS